MNKKLLTIFILTLLLTAPLVALADTLLPECALTDEGNCGLCDFIDLGLRLFRWILGIVGGLALLLFVWHGFGWLSSMGNSEKVKKSRDALLHTVVGILLILGSWLLVNMVVVILTFNIVDPASAKLAPTEKGVGRIFTGQAWNDIKVICNQ